MTSHCFFDSVIHVSLLHESSHVILYMHVSYMTVIDPLRSPCTYTEYQQLAIRTKKVLHCQKIVLIQKSQYERSVHTATHQEIVSVSEVTRSSDVCAMEKPTGEEE